MTDLPVPVFNDPRMVSADLRNHLRRLIIDNVLPPGSIINQAVLSRTFGVSRTPMREACRMLQEEGLIDVEMNQRARVTELDPNELDQLYAVRIVLESLAARLTAGSLHSDEVQLARTNLSVMRAARARGDVHRWSQAHRSFHRVCVIRADAPLLKLIESSADRTERYLLPSMKRHSADSDGPPVEHSHILDAIVDGDRNLAGSLLAAHLAYSCMKSLHDLSAAASGVATSEAVALAVTQSRIGSVDETFSAVQ